MKRFVFGIIVLFFIVIGFVAYRIFENPLEHYTISNNGHSITDSRGHEYVVSDIYLEALSLGKEIGETNDSGTIYEIKGQPEYNWIVFNATDEMTISQIFHKKQIQPFSISDKVIQEIRLVENKGLKQAMGIAIATTTESVILKELDKTLQETGEVQTIDTNNVMSLQVMNSGYKGIAFVNYATIDSKHDVYLSGFNNENYIKAGPLLSKWVLDNSQVK